METMQKIVKTFVVRTKLSNDGFLYVSVVGIAIAKTNYIGFLPTEQPRDVFRFPNKYYINTYCKEEAIAMFRNSRKHDWGYAIFPN